MGSNFRLEQSYSEEGGSVLQIIKPMVGGMGGWHKVERLLASEFWWGSSLLYATERTKGLGIRSDSIWDEYINTLQPSITSAERKGQATHDRYHVASIAGRALDR